MPYRRLFIWVEGDDDVRFFDRVVKPLFNRRFEWVEVRPYAQMKADKLEGFLRSIKAMGAEFLVVADINRAPCISERKTQLAHRLHEAYQERIAVVVREIEGWYLAGLDDESADSLGVSKLASTDDITKERFLELMPRRFSSRIDFMSEVLKCFSIEVAREKNKSFRHFADKHQLICG